MSSNHFKSKPGRVIVAVALLAASAFVVRAAEKQFSLPPETATLKPGPGSEMMAQCRMCHSVDYISTQPRFTRTVWTAEVNKMIAKYGAPISTNLVPQIVDYLTANYGQENPSSAAPKMEPKSATATKAGSPTPPYVYSLRVGGPQSFVGLTNLPETNPVHVSFKRLETNDDNYDGYAVFGVTNGEPTGIMIWNLRTQVPSKSGGTDGQGWDTIYDNYPTGSEKYSGIIPAKSHGELIVDPPPEGPWRLCILYSKAMPQPNPQHGSYNGNYEAISPVLKE